MDAYSDMILGLGVYERSSAPETILLPVLAARCPEAGLGFLAYQARFHARDEGTGGLFPIPAIEHATAAVLGLRKISDRYMDEVLREMPRLGMVLTDRASARDSAPEVRAYAAAATGDVRLAREAVDDETRSEELVRVRIACIPVLGEASAVLDEVVGEIDWLRTDCVTELAPALSPAQLDRLVEAWLASARPPPTLLAGAVALLPALEADGRWALARRCAELLADGALDGVAPDRQTFALRQLINCARAEDLDALRALRRDLGLPEPWNGHLKQINREPAACNPADPVAACGLRSLLDAHPYGQELVGDLPRALAEADEKRTAGAAGSLLVDSFQHGALLNDDEAHTILDRMMERWGGAGAPMEAMIGGDPEPDVPRMEGTVRGTRGVDGPPMAPAPRGIDSAPAGTRGAPERGPRRLQVDLRYDDDGDLLRARNRAFAAGRRHEVRTWIGWGGERSASQAFYEEAMEAGNRRLTFVFRPQGQDGTTLDIELPVDPGQESPKAAFEVTVPADATTFTAQVWIMQGERILQIDELAGDVVSDPREVSGETITLRNIMTLRHLPGGAPGGDTKAEVEEDDGGFGATFVADTHGLAGRAAAATGASEPSARIPDLHALQNEIEGLGADLYRTSAALARAGAGLDHEASVDLLFKLAAKGAQMFGALSQRVVNLTAADDRPIQIISADPSRRIPLELIYDRAPPVKRELCAGWETALAEGRCDACAALNETDEAPICPLGFWGIRKIIERQTAQDRPGDPESGFLVRSSPAAGRSALRPLDSCVVAASQNVTEQDLDAAGDFLSQRLTAANVAVVNDWDAWVEAVQEMAPALLVAMPHNEERDATTLLELGGGFLPAGAIRPKHYRKVEPPDPRPGPVVLLLGCRTADGPQGYHSFVAEFRNREAPVVIGTLNTILAEHALPLAQELVTQLMAQTGATSGPRTVGRAMRDMRRALLARGHVIALGVAAFGDADWVLP